MSEQTVSVIPERLKAFESIPLLKGGHSINQAHAAAPDMCLMEAVNWLVGTPNGWGDQPSCVSPVLIGFGISLNDSWDAEQRQKLKPFAPLIVGTAGDGLDEARSYLALDWLIRTYTPAWLDLAGLTAEAQALRDLRRIVDLAAAQAAGPVVLESREKARAAWAAARDAAGAAARDAARDAAWAAAGDAARDAVRDVLEPTVQQLQDSALELFAAMVRPEPVA